jgi:hypothetical protein
MERELTETLGTRVAIEPKEHGGKLSIDFMNEDDLRVIFSQIAARIQKTQQQPAQQNGLAESVAAESLSLDKPSLEDVTSSLDDRSKEEKATDENSFDTSNFSL